MMAFSVEGFAVKESFAEGNLPKRDLQWEDYVVVGFAEAKPSILRARNIGRYSWKALRVESLLMLGAFVESFASERLCD